MTSPSPTKRESFFLSQIPYQRAYLSDKSREYNADERVCQFSTEEEGEKICLVEETTGLSNERIVQIQEQTREYVHLMELRN